MAYRKASTRRRSSSGGRSRGYASRGRSAARKPARRRAVSAPRTLRIVIEQPVANPVAQPLVAASESKPRKAKF